MQVSDADFPVTGRCGNGQQQKVTGIPAGMLHSDKSNDGVFDHKRCSHQTIASHLLQDLIRSRTGGIVPGPGRNEKLSFFFKFPEPSIQFFVIKIWKIFDFCRSPVIAPVACADGFRAVLIQFKNIRTVCVIVSSNIGKDTVGHLSGYRFVQVITQKMPDCLFLSGYLLCKFIHGIPLLKTYKKL